MSWLDEQGNKGTGRTLRIAAAVLLAGSVVAGCSDDDGGDAASMRAEGTEAATETDDVATDDGGASAQEQVTVDIVDISDAFQPSTVTVAAGGEVTWVNGDDIPHTTTADDGTWDSGNLDPGEEFTFTSEEPGTYPYICTIHPTMKGEVIVE